MGNLPTMIFFIAVLLLQAVTLVFVILLFIRMRNGGGIEESDFSSGRDVELSGGSSPAPKSMGADSFQPSAPIAQPSGSMGMPSQMSSSSQMPSFGAGGTGGGVVFCRKCGEQYDAGNAKCPHCGFARK